MKYYDKLGFLHDSASADSNNKFIYTAYAFKIGMMKVITREMMDEIIYCWRNKVRHSNKITSPISRDEILGICYLVPTFAKELIERDFWMNYAQPIFNLKRFCSQVILLYKNRKDRNYWHRNNLEQTEFLTMKAPIADRAFFYELAGIKVPLTLRLVQYVDKKLKTTNRSSLAIRSFKYGGDGDKGIYDYFGKDENHPITIYRKSL